MNELKVELLHSDVTDAIIGAAIAVHSALGPGLLESAYRECLAFELHGRGVKCRREVETPVIYKGLKIDCAYKMDVVVADCVIVEAKSVKDLAPIHEAQLNTYMRLSGMRVGLLINFNVQRIRDGIVRRVL